MCQNHNLKTKCQGSCDALQSVECWEASPTKKNLEIEKGDWENRTLFKNNHEKKEFQKLR